MENIPPDTIHTLWIGGKLGPLEWLCLSSWVRLGYQVILHTYERYSVPKGVELYDASQLMSPDSVFRNRRNGSLATFSDIYRVLILKHFQGLWLDADIFLVRPFDFSARNVLAKENGDSIDNINNAVLKLSEDHPILCDIVKRFRNPYSALPWNKPGKLWQIFVQSMVFLRLEPKHLPWGALGYLAIQAHVSKYGFEGQILGSELCLTANTVALFDETDDPDASLSDPIVYVHFYRSQITCDLNKRVPSSVYDNLWKVANTAMPT